MGGLIGKDTPLVTLSCYNVRDTGDVNISRVDGKEREKEKKKEKRKKEKLFCFFRKKNGRGEKENAFEERRNRKISKFV